MYVVTGYKNQDINFPICIPSSDDIYCSLTVSNPYLMLSFLQGRIEAVALKIVSYIGCAISILFLVFTIIFFLAQG